jgi:endonuclease/exonuclease/phosphatase family metal-dependent hydrolase
MKNLAFLLLLVLAAFLPVQADEPTIRIATYNINWGNNGGEQLQDVIAKSKADIIFFQETTLQFEPTLRKQLAAVYPEFYSSGHLGKLPAERFAFASKVKLRDVKFHPPKTGLFGFYTATFFWGKDEIRLVSVHLTPIMVPQNATFMVAMNAVSAIEGKHATEIAAILKDLDPAIPTIIAGDFNSLSTFKAPKSLVEKGFIDSFAAIHLQDADQHPTWQWPTRPLPLKLRIDYIFHSKDLQTVKSEIIPQTSSDHFLVVSELKRSEKAVAAKPADN